MRIVLSRKGLDSSAGGCPSPLIDGRPVSLPIPTKMPSVDRYGDLPKDVAKMAADLSRGRVAKDNFCHLDPDIGSSTKPRESNWRGSFGQVSAAAAHLRNQNIGAGDLFLFRGLFRPAEHSTTWSFCGSGSEHRIFGWLQVGDVREIGADPGSVLAEFPWLNGHPHLEPGWGNSNTIYIAREQLQLDGVATGLPGWGLFNPGHRLTAAASRLPSLWDVPDWLNPKRGGVGMTYHPESRWSDDGTLRSAARGQEFVADIGERKDAVEWVARMFEAAT